jgi:hypothetical protein
MTSTYERIRSESLYWRAIMRCEFCIEFKDERFAPPPFNILLLPLTRCGDWFSGSSSGERPRGFATQMGRMATMRLQAHEQRCAREFDKQSIRDGASTTDARVAAIYNDLPTLQALSRQCVALEDANHTMFDMIQSQHHMIEQLYRSAKDSAGDDRADSRVGAHHTGSAWSPQRSRSREHGSESPQKHESPRGRGRENKHVRKTTILPMLAAAVGMEPVRSRHNEAHGNGHHKHEAVRARDHEHARDKSRHGRAESGHSHESPSGTIDTEPDGRTERPGRSGRSVSQPSRVSLSPSRQTHHKSQKRFGDRGAAGATATCLVPPGSSAAVEEAHKRLAMQQKKGRSWSLATPF